MPRFVNVNIYNNKTYHFDLETRILKEGVCSPNSWFYVLIPVATIFFRTIGEVIENTSLFATLASQFFDNQYKNNDIVRDVVDGIGSFLDYDSNVGIGRTVLINRVITNPFAY